MSIQAKIEAILTEANIKLAEVDTFIEYALVNYPTHEVVKNDDGSYGYPPELQEEAEELNELFDAFFGRKPKADTKVTKPEPKKTEAEKNADFNLMVEGLKALDAKFNAFLEAQKAGK